MEIRLRGPAVPDSIESEVNQSSFPNDDECGHFEAGEFSTRGLNDETILVATRKKIPGP